MALTTEQIAYIAHLARLEIKANKLNDYQHNLSNILAMVEQMNQIDTDSIQPMAHPLELYQRLRKDKVTEINNRDDLQKGAITQDGYYLVPKVIENA